MKIVNALAAMGFASALSMALPSLAASDGILFEDGDTTFWGHSDGIRCTGLCIKSERRGNSVISQVYDPAGRLRQTTMHDLVSERSAKASAGLIEVRLPAPGVVEVNEPNPPPGGTGPVTVTQVFNTTTGWTVIVFTFHFSNGLLVRVDYSSTIFNNMPE